MYVYTAGSKFVTVGWFMCWYQFDEAHLCSLVMTDDSCLYHRHPHTGYRVCRSSCIV